jgi:hypothetical protein
MFILPKELTDKEFNLRLRELFKMGESGHNILFIIDSMHEMIHKQREEIKQLDDKVTRAEKRLNNALEGSKRITSVKQHINETLLILSDIPTETTTHPRKPINYRKDIDPLAKLLSKFQKDGFDRFKKVGCELLAEEKKAGAPNRDHLNDIRHDFVNEVVSIQKKKSCALILITILHNYYQ